MSAALTAVDLGDWSNFKNLVSAAILQKRKKNTSNLKSEEPWILKFTLDYDLKYLGEPNQWNWRYGQRLDLGPWTVAMMIMTTTEMMMMTFENILTQELFTLLIGILVSPGELSSSSWEGLSMWSPAAAGPHRPVRSLQHHHHCHLPKAKSRAAATFHKFSRSGITRKISPVTITCSQGLQPRLQVNAVGNGEVREAPFSMTHPTFVKSPLWR